MRLVVNSDCPYQRRILQTAAIARGSDVHLMSADSADTPAIGFVDEYERIPWESVMRKPHREQPGACRLDQRNDGS